MSDSDADTGSAVLTPVPDAPVALVDRGDSAHRTGRPPGHNNRPASRVARHRRHAADDEDDSPDGSEAADDDAPRGRHGRAGAGLSVAEIIARLDAAAAAQTADLAGQLVQRLPEQADSGAPPLTAPGALLTTTPTPASRAGRNLPAAIAVGLSLGGVIATTLLTYRPSFVVVVLLAVAVGTYELVHAIATVEARAPLVPLLAGGLAMDIAAWRRGPDGLVGALLITAVAVAIWRLADGSAGYRQDVAAGTLVALYVPFLAGFAVLLAHPSDGAARVILFVAAVVCSDTGGYVAGILLGRHPMAPAVSPKKSWEGFGGSVVGSCLASALIMDLTFHQHWWKGAIFGVAIAVIATLGDLGESMIKRDLALKDMGHLLPGHGGLMDRLDSLLPCAPAAYLLLTLFLSR